MKRDFGPYTLVRRHAAGGMSMVYAANDRTLDREVALKILSEDYSADERRIKAFEREARITASFSHPNVVRVFTTGRAFGRFYIAMEMVSGGHLENLIRERGKIPEIEMLPLAIEVAQGLKAAQAAGLIHRDVKPGNILLDAAGHAKLVDFGLSLVTQGGKARATEIWATPYYVPPETVQGRTEDFRSDIYAFGATLYHSLSGKPPCDEESMATDLLCEAKKRVKPLAMADASISSATCRLVDHAMAYDPAGRFNSHDELICALTKALDLLKSGRADMHDAKKRIRRKWVIPVAVGVILSCGAPLALRLFNRPQPQAISINPPRAATLPATENVDHAAEIARSYRAARAAAAAGDFQTAEREFGALHDNPWTQEPTRSWAGVEAVLAAYLDARPEDAMRRASIFREHLRSLPSSNTLSGEEWQILLERLGDFRPLAAPDIPSPASRLAAAMLAGIKDWDQGLLDHAAACFKTASSVQLPPDDAWAAIYQKIAADHLHDYRILSGELFSVEPPDRAGCQKAIAQLDETMAALKTEGRARFNVRAWQLDLKRRFILPAGGGSISPSSETSLDTMLAKLADYSADRRFGEYAAWLKQLPDETPGVSRQALLTLAEGASAFLTDVREDLSREPFDGKLSLDDGVRVTRISMRTDGSITAIPESGEPRLCTLKDFPADALITLHRELMANPPSEIERLRRHECVIAFDWLAGNRKRALTDASKLSDASPAFKKRWGAISSGLPR